MVAKKSSSWSKAIIKLLLVVPSLFNLVSNFVAYLEYEVQLAKKSIITIIVLFGLAIVFSLSAWACLWLMVFFGLMKWFSTMAVLAIIFGTNILLMFIALFWISKAKNNLTFPQTRDLFH